MYLYAQYNYIYFISVALIIDEVQFVRDIDHQRSIDSSNPSGNTVYFY